MSPVTIAVFGALALWWLGTAIVQLPFEPCRRLSRYLPVPHLLPGWNFFAPKPTPADFAVWHRSWSAYWNDRGEVDPASASPWVELEGIDQRRLADGLLYPGRYGRKTIFGCSLRIISLLAKDECRSDPRTGLPSDAVLVGMPYLLLLNKVAALRNSAVAVQFRIDAIVHRPDGQVEHMLFRSAVHRRDPGPASDLLEDCYVAAS